MLGMGLWVLDQSAFVLASGERTPLNCYAPGSSLGVSWGEQNPWVCTALGQHEGLGLVRPLLEPFLDVARSPGCLVAGTEDSLGVRGETPPRGRWAPPGRELAEPRPCPPSAPSGGSPAGREVCPQGNAVAPAQPPPFTCSPAAALRPPAARSQTPLGARRSARLETGCRGPAGP